MGICDDFSMEGCQVKLRNVWSWPIVGECHAACTLKVGVCDDFSMEGGQVKLRNVYVWSWPIVGECHAACTLKDGDMWWLLDGGLSGKVTERLIVAHSGRASRCLHAKGWGMWWLLDGGWSGKVTERMIVAHSGSVTLPAR